MILKLKHKHRIFADKIILIIFAQILAGISSSAYSQNATITNISAFTLDGWEPGHNDSDLHYIASHYKLLVTDGYSYYNSKVPYLHQLNPDLKILAYKNATVIVQNSGDWFYVTANKPEWFLKDTGGNLIYEAGYPLNYLLNPANAEWKDYRANQLIQYVNNYGYDGIYLDVILPWILSGSYLYYNEHPVNPATGQIFTNAEWRQINLNFLEYMKQAIGNNKLLIFNGPGTGSGYYTWNVQPYLDIADGVIVEGFMRWSGNPINYAKSEVDWKKDVDVLKEIASAGKISFGYTNVSENVSATGIEIRNTHLYSLSSYLLGAGGETYYTFQHSDWITRYQPYNDWWSARIGASLGNYYYQNNLYQRDFTDGKVIVNPTDNGQTYALTLNKPYQDLEGNLITSVSLVPKTGIVLIDTNLTGIISSTTQDMDVIIFPNPSNDGKFYLKITAEFKNLKIAHVEIFNLHGKKVYSAISQINLLSNFQFNLSNMPDGIYILQICTSEGMGYKKLIKN